jgi:hypothetical protein
LQARLTQANSHAAHVPVDVPQWKLTDVMRGSKLATHNRGPEAAGFHGTHNPYVTGCDL